MAVSARTILSLAYKDIGVLAGGEPLTAEQGQEGLARLNNMVSSWQIQYGTVNAIERQVFDMMADIGGPDNPYSVGLGGDIDMPRPNILSGAGLLLNPGTDNPVEIPRAVITDDGYQSIQIKTLANTLFTCVYYNPTYPLGSLYLWPVPNTADNDLVLYYQSLFTGFADLNTEYDWPSLPGYAEALEYNVGKRLLISYPQAEPRMDVLAMADESLAIIKRANNRLVDMGSDAALLTADRRRGYNINTSNY